MRAALEGVRVLDAGQGAAGPFSPLLLSYLGAEVIKLEAPIGDLGRRLTTRYKGISHTFSTLNANKRGITLDLRTDKGKEILKELIKRVDIMVENFTPGTMEGWGLGYETLAQVNPRLIYASASGFGHGSAYSELPAFDFVLQAMGGVMASTGYPDSPPTKTAIAYVDMAAATELTVGILAALYAREKTGKGQWVGWPCAIRWSRIHQISTLSSHEPEIPREGSAIGW